MSGLSKNDTKYIAIEAIVHSPEGVAAMLKAVHNGQPALCGVDDLLRSGLDKYDDDDQSVKTAGSFVADVMRSKGFRENGSGSCLAGCVAKGGLLWTAR